MEGSFSALLDQAFAESSVAIFGMVDLSDHVGDGEAVAEDQLSQGADFLDVRIDGVRRSQSEWDEELLLMLERLAHRYPGRLCMLGDLAVPFDQRALNSLSLVRRPEGNGLSRSDLIDPHSAVMVGWSCSSQESSFSESLARLRALRSEATPKHLHLAIPRTEVEEGVRREGIVATQVALAVIEGATLLSVHDVRAAVKARDEIVKIQHAR